MLLILDCDGVLIDSETIAMEVDAEFLTQLGLPHTPEEAALRFVGIPHKDFIRTIEAELGRALTADELDGHELDYRNRMRDHLRPIDGVRGAIERLELPFCVASSTAMPSLRRNLATAGIVDLFDPHIFSASQVRRGKPAPDVFLFAASQMGADPGQILVVEDSVPGVTAARRAGFRVIGFVGGGHIPPGHADRLMAAGAVATFTHMDHLVDMVGAYHPG
jgi:HAD superfamily hydrolase (TIGR01509 family)